jgi:hypothetical protein
MIAPFVLVDGHDVELFPSLDVLVSRVEAYDVRHGMYEVFDGEGTAIQLTADSDLSPVLASPGDHAAGRLKTALVGYVNAVGPVRFGMADLDLATVDLAWLVRSIWVFQAGGSKPVW